MAKKKKVAKKKAPKNLREYHKQRMKGKKPVSIKKTIKKGIKYAKENPYTTALGVAAMHPGVRAVTGIKNLVKGGAKMQIQNSVLKNHKIEKPLPMLDLSKWEAECEQEEQND